MTLQNIPNTEPPNPYQSEINPFTHSRIKNNLYFDVLKNWAKKTNKIKGRKKICKLNE